MSRHSNELGMLTKASRQKDTDNFISAISSILLKHFIQKKYCKRSKIELQHISRCHFEFFRRTLYQSIIFGRGYKPSILSWLDAIGFFSGIYSSYVNYCTVECLWLTGMSTAKSSYKCLMFSIWNPWQCILGCLFGSVRLIITRESPLCCKKRHTLFEISKPPLIPESFIATLYMQHVWAHRDPPVKPDVILVWIGTSTATIRSN